MYKKGHPVREKAFDMYVQGLSLREIAQTLRVSTHTVLKWRDEDSWESRRAGIVARAVEQGDEQRIDAVARAFERTLVEMDNILRQVMHLAEPRSLEGVVRTRLQLMQVIRDHARGRAAESVEAVVEAVIEAILQFPKIKPIIERYRDEIMASVQQNLKRKGVLADG